MNSFNVAPNETDGNWFLFMFISYNTEMNCFELGAAFVQQKFNIELHCCAKCGSNESQWISIVCNSTILPWKSKRVKKKKIENIMKNRFSFSKWNEMAGECEIYERWTGNTNGGKKYLHPFNGKKMLLFIAYELNRCWTRCWANWDWAKKR